MGMSHEIAQGEGGEQGDPLMPMLFALGLHPALRAAQARMRAGERIFAYLDDCVRDLQTRTGGGFSRSLRRRCLRTLRSGSTLGRLKSGTGQASARHQFPDQECEGCEAGRHRVERRCVLAFGTTGSEDSGGGLGPHPSGPPFRLPPFGPHPSGAHPF